MKPTQPNILLIAVHDLGTMLGCYGADPVLHTPHLDGFAAEGVRWASHFATAPFCSPSRGGIVTGMVPHVNGLMGLVNLGWDMPEGPRTIGQILGDAGYETRLFGLQHEAKDAARLGFEWTSDPKAGRASPQVAPLVADWLRAEGWRRERPFYVQVGFTDVHRPYPEELAVDVPLEDVRPLPYLEDTPGLREDLRDFYGLIQRMDSSVGVILDALDAAGLRESTLVVFTTDHGIAFPRAKCSLYDPGINTALMMRWPAGFEGGRALPHLLSNVDLLPTLLEAVGIESPMGLQGSSFLPALRGEPYEERDWVFAEMNTVAWDPRRCVRTREFKYISNYMPGPVMRLPTDIEGGKTRRDMGEPPFWVLPLVELYDLRADPLEMENLAGGEDSQSRRIEGELARTLEEFQRVTCDPILKGPIERPVDEREIIRAIFERIGKPLE